VGTGRKDKESMPSDLLVVLGARRLLWGCGASWSASKEWAREKHDLSKLSFIGGLPLKI
jgi:hypothetical protein